MIQQPSRSRPGAAALDGRFAEEAVVLLVNSMARTGTKPGEYLVDLYGGADTMPDQVHTHKFNIGERNIEKALELVDRYGFQLQTVDVGGNDPRNVTLDMKTGQVELKRGKPAPAPAPKPHAGAHLHAAKAPAVHAPARHTAATHKPHGAVAAKPKPHAAAAAPVGVHPRPGRKP